VVDRCDALVVGGVHLPSGRCAAAGVAVPAFGGDDDRPWTANVTRRPVPAE